MIGKRSATAIAVAAIVLIAGALPALPPLDRLRGLSLDALTGLRWRLFGNVHAGADSPSVVIALDEETYNTPPFKGAPTIAWTREIGRVVAAVLEGGARVVGFDIVLPTSIEETEIDFDSETIGAKLRGFDREFLRALAAGAKADKIVLGEVQIGDNLLLPAAGQRVAVGQQRNMRSLNVFADPDDVVRRAPLTLMGRSGLSPSMALELAARAEGATPEIPPDQVSLAGYTIPLTGANEMTLSFAGGANDIPTYSLADLRGCLEKDDKDFFRRNFAGKAVLVGSTFDLGDLKLTSKRFAVGMEEPKVERCTPAANIAPRAGRDEINGVYIQATAVNNILRREAVAEAPAPLSWLLSLGAAALGALGALVLTPIGMMAGYALLAFAWTASAAFAFSRGAAAPLFAPLVAALVALVATAGYRLILADRDKLALRKNFELYLSPALIKKMLSSSLPPALGGEVREITALFFDLVGYSSISERLAPAELVALINRYLSAMTEVIEAHGGFVDKYVGDAIVAIFGAPIDAPDHAADAVRAVLACNGALGELNRSIPLADGVELAHRVGLNSGQALVGNIGSKRRFNYTAIGDAVNIAARLESANRHFRTTILASQATVERCGEAFLWREIDTIRVKGRAQPIRVFEPVALSGQASAEQRARALGYAEGLARWRARDFPAAARAFARCAERDPPSASFLDRVEKLRHRPPADNWEPIYVPE
jgi:class 3 adenylate cyclase/CHASE2 domain-containing sensor protein